MEWIEIKVKVKAPIDKVWECWTDPKYITRWNFANADWCCPKAENNLQPGGRFSYRMEAKDGSFAFDFEGTYDAVEEEKLIKYTMADNRQVEITFSITEEGVLLKEAFQAEGEHEIEMQRTGWQAILENFKLLVERLH